MIPHTAKENGSGAPVESRKELRKLAKKAWKLYLEKSTGPGAEAAPEGEVLDVGLRFLRTGSKNGIFDLLASLFTLDEGCFTVLQPIFDRTADAVFSDSRPEEDAFFLPALRGVLDALLETRTDRDYLHRIGVFLMDRAAATEAKGRRLWSTALAGEALKIADAALRAKKKKSTKIDTAALVHLRERATEVVSLP